MSLERNCPICSGARARTVWREAGLRYVRCSICGATFSDVAWTRYAAEQHNTWHDDGVSAATTAFYGDARELVHQRFLDRFPPAGERRLLDVGCGLGYFVERALASGWDATGCDTSSVWTSRASARVGAERIVLGAADHPDVIARGPFDLVTSWDVLEHVHDPLPFLRSLASLVAPGGSVFIRTPNLAWVYPTYWLRRRLFGEAVELGPLNHVVYYTAATLRRALPSAGLEPVAWPVLPPPQVGIANRDSGRGTTRAITCAVKNAHAAGADRLGRFTAGRLLLGSDLDVVAVRAR